MITKFKLFETYKEDDSDLKGSEEWIDLQKDARKQTLLGKHIRYCYEFEDRRYGFELEDESKLMFDENMNWIEYDLPDRDHYITQKAKDDYDLTRSFKDWKNGGDEPIFPTKSEAKKFIDFCQKYLREKPKIKLKYLLTKDYKEKKVPMVSKEDIEKVLLGEVVTIREIDDIDTNRRVTYKDVEWTCTNINYEPEENRLWNYIHLRFENKDKDDFFLGFNSAYKISYIINFNELGEKGKEEIELTFGNDDENLINKRSEFKPIIKELQKLFK